MDPVFVVIAPHACPATGRIVDPGCDSAADRIASQLYVQLRKRVVPDRVRLLIPSERDRRRAVLDPNRAAGRAHPLRARLRDILQDHGSTAIVVDVHSYEDDTPRIAQGEPWGAWEMIVLDEGPSLTPYARDFAEAMGQQGVVVPVVRGRGNDIMVETRQMGGRALLLEFNEALVGEARRSVVADTAQALVDAQMYSISYSKI